MLALMRMDWTQNRRMLFYLMPLWMLWGSYLFAPLPDQAMLGARIFLGFLFPLVLSLLVMLQNHTRPIDDWLCALPVSRAQIVLARYASTALAILVGLLIPLLLTLLTNAMALKSLPRVPMHDYLVGLGIDAAVLLVFGWLFLPLYFRFGADKGLGILGAVIVSIAGWLFWRWGYEGCMQRFMDLLTRLMDDGVFRGWILIGVAVLAGVSIAFSLWAYPQRTQKAH